MKVKTFTGSETAKVDNLPVTSHGAHDVTVHLLAACPNRSYLELMGSD